MKFVKNRKVYDTDTADELFSWDEPYDPGSFSDTSYSETLYRSPQRALFLYRDRDQDIQLMDDIDEIAEWLDKKSASPKVYKELGIELEEG